MTESVRLGAFTRLDRVGLVVLGLFSAASVAGFASFGLHPQLLARFPSSAPFYAPAFQIFARGHVMIAFAVLSISLTARVRWRWLPALLVAGGLSLGAELLGTATGFPFGGYRYTPMLGYRVAGLVPLLIPLSWFMMAFPSYVLARRAIRGRLARWALGAVLLTTWDLTLDPAMSSLTSYWVWETAGPFYGMPLVNLAGWLATSLFIMAGFDAVRAGPVADRIPPRLMAVYYATVLALSAAMTLAAGYWGAVFATLAVLLVFRQGAVRARAGEMGTTPTGGRE